MMEWRKDFELGVEQMDKTHKEFVELVAAAKNALKAELTEIFAKLISHTRLISNKTYPFISCSVIASRLRRGNPAL
ncbi:MAG: hypothetical protein LBG21_00960 [Campylobacteraceae bacterium]|jgi:hypothetical protein|nr:hypothetical protein [Campylobacteraceae bacterium]